MLTSKQRASLRGMAAKQPSIFQIGKDGVSEEICLQLSNALEARELIKIRVLETCDTSAASCANAIAAAISAEVVAVVGNTFVLYRESKKKKRIFLDE